jgi:Na+/melibiose symporter-like transporter
MTDEVDRELQDLKQKLSLLQREHARTRNGWLNWIRSTGQLLLTFGAALILGVLTSHRNLTNPVAATFGVMAIFMLVLGLWSFVWSLRPMAEKLMKADATGRKATLGDIQ